jgi:hypothetical protein
MVVINPRAQRLRKAERQLVGQIPAIARALQASSEL